MKGGEKEGNWEVGRDLSLFHCSTEIVSFTTVSDCGTKAKKAQWIKDFSHSDRLLLLFLFLFFIIL